MGGFKITQDDEKKFTQADVDRIVGERLPKEKAKYTDYDQLKANLDAAKAENDKLKSKLDENKDSLRKALKIEVATAHNLPEAMAERLQGESKEELETDAKTLSESLGPGPSVGSRTNPPQDKTKPFTRADIKSMSSSEITENWDQISQQLKDGSLSKI